ncbi:MAG TPA: pilin, partial [Gemmatimonadales bacterium]|nr:pilin [Gemmatimonadales bacterium]
IGILAAIAIPKFANTKAKAYIASMKSDLRNLVTAEEAFFADSVKYSGTTSCTVPPTAGTVNFCVTTGNVLGGPTVNGGGWSATITNRNLTNPLVTCAIFINTAAVAPAVSEGAPACQ